MYYRASYTVGSHFSFPTPRSLVKQPPREKPSSFEGHFASRLILAWNRPFCTLGIRGFFCLRRLPRNASSVTGRRPISRQTPHAEKTSDSQGTKWPIPSKDKSTCKMSFERRGLLPWRLLNQGTGSWKGKMGPYSVASPTIHTLSLFSSDFQLSFPLACSSFPFPRSKGTHLFGAKPLEEIVSF